eukprot:CAMPEP_0204615438 /NCGR_PEP_ID=MMETSP0717-20131115/2940_1 /ASSEMBLY_ACC=CAM_ASM_000666 /TAXON_ID=230516 /ORGANISM="Chaetoceros curvisetus" /LENGTH=368 /DNA_ID=CAMNT_0051628385 /DNA_START=1542 /DNA_END=2648 /DNA_ORIENTATION=-
MPRSVLIIPLILISHIPTSCGHFLWHQRVSTDGGDSTSSLFTFSELPGLENANNENLAKMAYEKGIQLNYANLDGSSTEVSVVNLKSTVESSYIMAKLPAKDLPKSYLLEGYCQWGIFGEGDAPPSLLRYFTSASKYFGTDGSEKLKKASTNEFRINLHITHGTKKCDGGGTRNAQSGCVQISVVHKSLPVPDLEVSLFHGHPEPTKVTTDAEGIAWYSVPRSHERIFARANLKIDTPGETSDGDAYDVISNWATSVLELGKTMQSYPSDVVKEQEGSKESHDDVQEESHDDVQEENTSHSKESESSSEDSSSPLPILMVEVALISFIGSFVGSALSSKIRNRYRNYDITANTNLDNPSLELDKGEAC